MPTRSERRRSRVRLTVSEVNAPERTAPAPTFPLIPVALAAGAASGIAGWLLTAGLVMVAWFTAMAMPVPTALGFASQFWLAGHGIGAVVGTQLVTIAPLGLSALFVLVVRAVTPLVLRAAPVESLDGRGVLKAWALATAGYAAVAGVVALTSGASPRVGWALVGGVAVGGLGAGWALAGRLRALFNPPPVLRGIGRATLAGLGTMTAIAAAVLLIGLLLGSERIVRIEEALAPDGVGSWLLVILQLLFLPNLLAWTASWALGAGVSVGVGSLVSPMLTTAGMLPAIPVFGAVPEPGAGGPWSYAWLASGVLAGAAAGWVATSRSATRGSLAVRLTRGAGAGLATAVIVLLLAALSGGNLGAGRLVGLGPVLLNLLWLAPAPMAVGGAGAALLHWFLRGRRLPADATPEDSTEPLDLPTEPLETETIGLSRD
ncbi:MAG: DUF6350 family protein [Micropruina sp.]|uniref:cell division protein PerM n=1 Tax=Micropruina sp. TaxID=2737536 RepID=UPI0039E4BFA9